ncbi:methionine ABC transporter ATP-binding protein [Janibacter terrae]|uniref:methionine ABC transporter ATP-binding protein n=1 Tax=Janibacter terrae TaxID=103817 RepID=UPI00082F5F3B|nr:methionine ABC transporter ATP-binding protein [Janibacter terrae]MBA4083736.1 methionine ABC transporter ATP-binding protein [Kytococcus sp.]
MFDVTETPLLQLSGLRKEFPSARGPVVALDDITLSIARGSIHGIVGRSGAGKSTLIRCLTGLERPTSGTVDLDGTDIPALAGEQLRAVRRRFGMVFQHANLLDSRTAADNIALPLEIAGWSADERRARVAELLELVGLTDRADNHPGQLSGGQQQRVGIARALATRPDILLCDEPTSALDAATTRQILGLLRDLREHLGITVVIITHEPSVVREVCDTVTLLADGRVVETGPIGEVVADPRRQLHRDLVPLPPLPLGHEGGYVEVALGDSRSGTTSVDAVLALLREAGIPAEVAAATLETIAGRRVGRIQLEVEPARTGDAVRVLEAAHLSPEVAA